MGFTRSYLISLLLYVSIVNEIRLPMVNCQLEEAVQCIPKRTILALLRLSGVSSNLAAYSRTASVMRDEKNRNKEEESNREICMPVEIYLELFKDPVLVEHLNIIARTQGLLESPGRLVDDNEEDDVRDLSKSQKRSIAMLAKNDDLPATVRDRLTEDEGDEEEKRGLISSDQSGQTKSEILREYLSPIGQLNLEALVEEFPLKKRNVAALARDFALPPGRRNFGSPARDYELPNGKRNIDTILRDRSLPFMDKRNVASLARTYTLPQAGKRNIASIAKNYRLPNGKRYVGSLARTNDLPLREENKRSISSLLKNSNWPISSKRGISVPGSVILGTLFRHGRSLIDDLDLDNDILDFQQLASLEQSYGRNGDSDSFRDERFSDFQGRSNSSGKSDSNEDRPKRRIVFSDEYPLPVMQNVNSFDYEEMMEALADQYSNVNKRFMGRIPQMGPRPTTPATRRQGR